MRMLIGILVIVLLAGWLGTLMALDPGYVLFAWDHYSLETSVWFALVFLVALLAILRLVMALFGMLFGSRRGLSAWNSQRLTRRAQRQTTVGLLAISEGNFEKARRILVGAASRVDAPLINYLEAARAAHELGDFESRDGNLQLALESTPGATLAVGITQAELQISHRQWEQALATLLPLRKEAPRNAHVLRMLRSTYEALEDWQGLVDLIPDLRRTEVIEAAEIEELERRTWRSELRRAARIEGAQDGRLAALERAWEKMPKRLRQDAELIEAFVRELLVLDAGDTAESVLRASLRRDWHEALVSLYGRITSADAEQQYVAAQSWLKERPNSDVLLLTLGRLSLRTSRWVKAREFFEASARLHRTAEAFAELGRLCAHQGDFEQASEYFEESLKLQRDFLPALPLPETVGQLPPGS